MSKSRPGASNGFTLVELMVTLAVMAVLLTLAVPSFIDYAQRWALRGAADNVVGVIGVAKEEAIKRDSLVRVNFKTVGTGFCVGAATVAAASDAGCDCSTSDCPVGLFPGDGNELHNVALAATPSFGSDSSFVIDPKTGMLADFADTGQIELKVPRGFGVAVRVNAMGRATLCTPTSAQKPIPGMGDCP